MGPISPGVKRILDRSDLDHKTFIIYANYSGNFQLDFPLDQPKFEKSKICIPGGNEAKFQAMD